MELKISSCITRISTPHSPPALLIASAKAAKTTTITITELKLEVKAVTTIQTTFKVANGGTFMVNGEPVSQDAVYNQNADIDRHYR